MIIAHHLGLANQEYYQWFHTGQGVSIFLFCSAFVLSKKQGLYSVERIKKLARRILYPMLFCTMILFAISCAFMPPTTALDNCIRGAGFGPGSYYPWMYIIFLLFIPIYQKVNSRCANVLQSFIAISLLSAVFEILFYLFSTQIDSTIASNIWRVLPIRYLMIIFAALNFRCFESRPVLNVFILLACGVLAYIDIYATPIAPSFGWLGYHWFTTLYVVPLIMILKRIKFGFLGILGKYSYEIFLIQMMVFYVINNFAIAWYPTYKIHFTIIELILIVSLSYLIIKIKKHITI